LNFKRNYLLFPLSRNNNMFDKFISILKKSTKRELLLLFYIYIYIYTHTDTLYNKVSFVKKIYIKVRNHKNLQC